MNEQIRTEIELLIIQFYQQHEVLQALSEELRERTSSTLIDFEQMCEEVIVAQDTDLSSKEREDRMIRADYYNEEFYKQSGNWFLTIQDWQLQYEKLEDLRDEIERYHKMIYGIGIGLDEFEGFGVFEVEFETDELEFEDFEIGFEDWFDSDLFDEGGDVE